MHHFSGTIAPRARSVCTVSVKGERGFKEYAKYERMTRNSVESRVKP